jgi:membrane-associated phospholipid phosphatase
MLPKPDSGLLDTAPKRACPTTPPHQPAGMRANGTGRQTMHHRSHAFGRRQGLAALGALGVAGLAGALGWRAQASGAAADEGTWCSAACGRLVPEWSLTAYAAIKAENGYSNPLAASRTLAMMHIAMHDAVNAAAPRYATHALHGRAAGADPAVAAASAAHDVLAAHCPGQAATLARELERVVAEAGRGPEVERGLALGRDAARAILADRAEDGAAATLRYVPGARPGAYRFTPGFDLVFAPHWRAVKPFALRSPAQFRVGAPPALSASAYTEAFAEVKAFGGKAYSRRSEDQTNFAHFWYEFSDIGWNRVARVVAADRGLDLWEAARLFALVNMAMADAYVAGWDSKLHHDFWRPVTAIRLAAQDGNPDTFPDSAWEPLLTTPPIQDHPSTHSALGAAAAAVMAGLLGDATPFSFASTTALPGNRVRRFASFSAAAAENAESRVMAGLHFRFSCEAGLGLGDRIGRFALANHLRRVE